MNDKTITQTQVVSADSGADASSAPIGFFAIGIVINVVLLVAYGIWAFRQWSKSERYEE